MHGKITAILAAAALTFSAASALIYDASEKVSLAPTIAFDGDDCYIAWARYDRTLKFGRFTLSPAQGGQANLQGAMPMTSRTNDPFALALGGGEIFLAWVDYQTGKATVARYTIGANKDKFENAATKVTSLKPQGGVSLACDGSRLYLGYTDGVDKIMKVMSLSAAQKGKLTLETERKLPECETVVGSSVAVCKGTLVACWVNADKKILLTTYKIEESSKGTAFTFLRETRTEIRAMTEPFVDRPVVTAAEGEVYLAFVDKSDKTVHVNFYELKEDGALKLTGETRISERPTQPLGVGVDKNGKVFVAFVDQNKNLLVADK